MNEIKGLDREVLINAARWCVGWVKRHWFFTIGIIFMATVLIIFNPYSDCMRTYNDHEVCRPQ